MSIKVLRKVILAGSLAMVSSLAFACVELNTTIVGTDAINHCAYPVNISWCSGLGCTPPPGASSPLLRPGYALHLTDSRGPIRFVSCRAPRTFDGTGCSIPDLVR
jgi:hypothetical protein